MTAIRKISIWAISAVFLVTQIITATPTALAMDPIKTELAKAPGNVLIPTMTMAEGHQKVAMASDADKVPTSPAISESPLSAPLIVKKQKNSSGGEQNFSAGEDGEDPPLPPGWTRAESNENFAFRVINPYSRIHILQLADLWKLDEDEPDAIQDLAIVDHYDPYRISSIRDVSPGGEVVVYGVNLLADANFSSAIIQRIDDPSDRSILQGQMIRARFNASGNRAIIETKAPVAYQSDTILGHTRVVRIDNYKVANEFYRFFATGDDAHEYADLSLILVTRRNPYTNSFEALAFDTSEGPYRIRLIDTINLAGDSSTTYPFIDVRETSESRTVLISFDGANDALTVIRNVRTKEEVRFTEPSQYDGWLIVNAEYLGNSDNAILTMQEKVSGNIRTVHINLETLDWMNIPNLPEGWERAESNLNFAFRIFNPGSRTFILQLADLVKLEEGEPDAIQDLASVSHYSPYRISSIRDVSPNGEVVVYGVGVGITFPIVSKATIQKVEDANQKVVLKGDLIRINFSSNEKRVTVETKYSLDELGETIVGHSRAIRIQTLATIAEFYRIFEVGENVHEYPGHNLTLINRRDGGFETLVFDTSEGPYRLRLIDTINLIGDIRASYPFIDVRATSESRTVLISFDGPNFALTVVRNVRTKKEVRFEEPSQYNGWIIVKAEYIDNSDDAVLTLQEKVSGALRTVSINLETLEWSEGPPVPSGWTRAPSNVNFAYRIFQDTFHYELQVMNLLTGEEYSLERVRIGSEHFEDLIDVSPDGQSVVYGVDATTSDPDFVDRAIVYDLATNAIQRTFDGLFIRYRFIGYDDSNAANRIAVETKKSIGQTIIGHTRIFRIDISKIVNTFYRIFEAGPNAHFDDDAQAIIVTARGSSGNFEAVVFDSSEGPYKLRKVHVVNLGSDTDITHHFIDARRTPSGDLTVIINFETPHGGRNLRIVNTTAKKGLNFSGWLVQSVDYSGDPWAVFQLEDENGFFALLHVNLTTMEWYWGPGGGGI